MLKKMKNWFNKKEEIKPIADENELIFAIADVYNKELTTTQLLMLHKGNFEDLIDGVMNSQKGNWERKEIQNYLSETLDSYFNNLSNEQVKNSGPIFIREKALQELVAKEKEINYNKLNYNNINDAVEMLIYDIKKLPRLDFENTEEYHLDSTAMDFIDNTTENYYMKKTDYSSEEQQQIKKVKFMLENMHKRLSEMGEWDRFGVLRDIKDNFEYSRLTDKYEEYSSLEQGILHAFVNKLELEDMRKATRYMIAKNNRDVIKNQHEAYPDEYLKSYEPEEIAAHFIGLLSVLEKTNDRERAEVVNELREIMLDLNDAEKQEFNEAIYEIENLETPQFYRRKYQDEFIERNEEDIAMEEKMYYEEMVAEEEEISNFLKEKIAEGYRFDDDGNITQTPDDLDQQTVNLSL